MTVVYDMSNEAYHLDPALSASGAKTIAMQSLAHYRYGKRTINAAAADLGTAVHTMVLEPHLTDAIRIGGENKRGNAWKEAKAACDAEGSLCLTDGEYKEAKDMAEAVLSNPTAADLLSGDLVAEASVFATDVFHNVPLRCRPDGWRRDIGAIVDLKTTIDPSPEGFAKQAANFGYHIQDIFYRRVMMLAGHDIDRFIFVAVGKDAPYPVGVYELDSVSLDEGRAAVQYALEQYATAQKSGIYGYGYGELQTLRIPPWSLKFTQAN